MRKNGLSPKPPSKTPYINGSIITTNTTTVTNPNGYINLIRENECIQNSYHITASSNTMETPIKTTSNKMAKYIDNLQNSYMRSHKLSSSCNPVLRGNNTMVNTNPYGNGNNPYGNGNNPYSNGNNPYGNGNNAYSNGNGNGNDVFIDYIPKMPIVNNGYNIMNSNNNNNQVGYTNVDNAYIYSSPSPKRNSIDSNNSRNADIIRYQKLIMLQNAHVQDNKDIGPIGIPLSNYYKMNNEKNDYEQYTRKYLTSLSQMILSAKNDQNKNQKGYSARSPIKAVHQHRLQEVISEAQNNLNPDQFNQFISEIKQTENGLQVYYLTPPTNKMLKKPSLQKDYSSMSFPEKDSLNPPSNPNLNSGNQRSESKSPRNIHKFSPSVNKNSIQETKIAEIKKCLALSNSNKQISRKKLYDHLPNVNSDIFLNDTSALSDNLTNPDDDLVFEEDDTEISTKTGYSNSKPLLLLQSVYEGRPATVFFTYPLCCEKTRDTTRTMIIKQEDEKIYDLRYKSSKLYCVIKAFECAGFKRTTTSNWNGLWGKPKQDRINDMNKYQKVNHFPGCWQLGRKDNLWRNLSRLRRQYPSDFNFVPNTYLLNTDYDRFLQIKELADNKALWILKPCASACGRGIRLINKKAKLKKKLNYLVQEYISNPHLINGFKYDLRLYVLVSSYDPLRIYLYNQGLVRFATEKYALNNKSLKQRFIHLTNWSINKHSDNFIKNQNTDKDDEGSKWSLQALLKKYGELGIDFNDIFTKIKDIIVKSIICAEPFMLSPLNRSLEHHNNCYELYGFDILIDNNLKPWIMEINVCPSLNSSSPLDKKIKTTLISDIMHLIGYIPYDKKRYEEEILMKKRLQENRKYIAKNINDVLDLNEDNCIAKLNPEDWNILFETDEEYYRKGDFERIFPLKENIDAYSKYFEVQRYNNIIVWKWLMNKNNFLEKICKKII